MSGLAHILIRLAQKECALDQILSTEGMAMLIPMPVVWLRNWTMIGLDTFAVATGAPFDAMVQVWVATLGPVGARTKLALGTTAAIALALLLNLVFALLASLFTR